MLKRALFFIFLLLLIFIFNAFLNPIPKRKTIEGFRPAYGVSYSFEQAGWYGIDPRQGYIDLISNYQFDWVRVPFFWNQSRLRSSGASDGQVTDELNLEDLKFSI